jgi:2'-phosphotransferase
MPQFHSTNMANERVSKTLSWLLRHHAAKEGLAIDEGGYVPCAQIIAYLKTRHLRVTIDDLREITAACPKQRFEMKHERGKDYMRATQGHSIKTVDDEALLELIIDPARYPVAVHGTVFKFWPSIAATGLRCGSRNHIHIAIGEPGAGHVISGARATSDVLIYIDIAAAIADGIKFYVSTNNVILTRGVDNSGQLPTRYFSRVLKRNRGAVPPTVLWPVAAADASESASASAGACDAVDESHK